MDMPKAIGRSDESAMRRQEEETVIWQDDDDVTRYLTNLKGKK